MTRQLLGSPVAKQLTASPGQAIGVRNREARLRQRRSPAYLEALRNLDAGGALASEDSLAALREAIAAEFPEAEGAPLGWVAKCYLGVPYEVHTLDACGSIAHHYRWGEALPPPLERARALARTGRYLLIEVHVDRLVAVADDGSTSVCAI